MCRRNRLVLYTLILAIVLLSFFYAVLRASASLLLQPLQQIDDAGFSSSFLFCILVIFLLAYIKRRKRICVDVVIILGLASCPAWFSGTDLWAEYDISLEEQKIIAVFLGITAILLLVSRSVKNEKRKHFTQAVRRHVIYKQKGKCVMCKEN
jgi:hypothetical protein